MEKFKLIQMVSFILERRLFITNNDISESDLLAQIFLYTKFLKQKLELWMFVPCKLVEGVWVVLKEPYEYQKYLKIGQQSIMRFGDNIYNQCKEYQEAKERCLFEGFEYIKDFNISRFSDHTEDVLILGEDVTIYPKTFEDADETYNIENLTYYDGLVELTPTALKQLCL